MNDKALHESGTYKDNRNPPLFHAPITLPLFYSLWHNRPYIDRSSSA